MTFLCMPLQHQFLSEALQWRAQTDPDHVLYVLLNAKVNQICVLIFYLGCPIQIEVHFVECAFNTSVFPVFPVFPL